VAQGQTTARPTTLSCLISSAAGEFFLAIHIGLRGVASRDQRLDAALGQLLLEAEIQKLAADGVLAAEIVIVPLALVLPTDPSASSWQGLLVAPQGVPLPPECLVATRPAGAAPRPASRRVEKRP
jgi:hypothetical protein